MKYFFGHLNAAEHEFLYRFASWPGNHVDIGTYTGGSAYTAALAKGPNWVVHTFDPNCGIESGALEKWQKKNDVTYDNVVEHRETVWDWEPIPDISTAFVDGDHEEGVWRDARKLAPIVTKYIIFDDYDHGNVRGAVAELLKSGWAEVEQFGKLISLERL
jgi:hypothetical protein